MEEKDKSKTEEDIPDKKTPESPAPPPLEKEDSKKSSKKEDSKKENEKQNPESSTKISPFLLKINPQKLIYSSSETMEIFINNPTDKIVFVILHFDSFFISLKSEDMKLFEMQENYTCNAKKGYKIMKPNESIVLKIEQMKHDNKTSPNEFYNYKTPEGYLEIFYQEIDLVPPEFMKITAFDDFSDKLNYEKWAVRKKEIELKELTESLKLWKEKFNESTMNKSKKRGITEPKAKKEMETVSFVQRKKAREEKEKQELEEEKAREKEERERDREERRIKRIKEIQEKEKERDEYDRKVERMKQMVIKQEQWKNEKNDNSSKMTTQNSSKKEKKTIEKPVEPQPKNYLSTKETFNGGTDDEKKEEDKKGEEKKKKKNPCCTIL